ncbi:hypothetical protein [Streptomyces spongiae]|uniref:hypothetical protein n=1 Tax=Streptomyces spongiae TaxID=565072 RepID=UPI0018836EDD|nr:hypothetical protein [Streptomyces spongiae]
MTAEMAASVVGRLVSAFDAELHMVSANRRFNVERFEGGKQEITITAAEQTGAVR